MCMCFVKLFLCVHVYQTISTKFSGVKWSMKYIYTKDNETIYGFNQAQIYENLMYKTKKDKSQGKIAIKISNFREWKLILCINRHWQPCIIRDILWSRKHTFIIALAARNGLHSWLPSSYHEILRGEARYQLFNPWGMRRSTELFLVILLFTWVRRILRFARNKEDSILAYESSLRNVFQCASTNAVSGSKGSDS